MFKNKKEEPFNVPKRSPSGCLMGSTEGKNTTETIMEILKESTKESTKKTTLDEYEELGTIDELRVMKEKMEEIQKILNNYEKTFAWGCNDSIHPAIAHAIYGIVEDKDYFLEEYKEFLNNL